MSIDLKYFWSTIKIHYSAMDPKFLHIETYQQLRFTATRLYKYSCKVINAGIYILAIFVQIEKQGRIWRRTSWKKEKEKRKKW